MLSFDCFTIKGIVLIQLQLQRLFGVSKRRGKKVRFAFSFPKKKKKKITLEKVLTPKPGLHFSCFSNCNSAKSWEHSQLNSCFSYLQTDSTVLPLWSWKSYARYLRSTHFPMGNAYMSVPTLNWKTIIHPETFLRLFGRYSLNSKLWRSMVITHLSKVRLLRKIVNTVTI